MPEDGPELASRLAPAKINLCLHVGPVDGRGYHPLQSLVVFADIGDILTLTDRPGLTISGPFGAGLSAGEDNLVMKALRRFEDQIGEGVRHGVHLDKQLPIASGIGGGSADAGAVLHLLRAAYAPDMDDLDLTNLAAQTGADGPMCLWSRSGVAEGYGERLSDVKLPLLPCVLVNPLVECSTALVYNAFDALEPKDFIDIKHMFSAGLDVFDVVERLGVIRNDLQPAAIHLQPVISQVLESLDRCPETRLARMSGSGATCFALCESDEDARALSGRMQREWPGCWVRACRLG